jgi:hypothetical protein
LLFSIACREVAMRRITLTALILTLSAGAAVASFEDEATSLSYIAYLERYATVQPATQEQELEAVINMPLVAGDRIDTAREARVELILSDASVVWLDEYTTLSLDAVAYSRDTLSQRTVLFLAEGQLVIELPSTMEAVEPTRIDGAGETVYLEGPGLYRVENLRSGGLRVEVWRGFAEAATAAGNVRVRTEYTVEVSAGMVSDAIPDLTTGDDFARWVQSRRSIAPGQSSRYVDARYAREASQLDTYGTWVYLDSHNTWAWQPTVSVEWSPYRAGRWYWTVTGWNWLSYEPWGWLPYHYGNWFFAANVGWVWSWHSVWSPAWVYWSHWPGYVGWCPYGWYGGWWYDRYPHWPPHGGSGRPHRGDVVPPPGGGGGGGVVPRDARPVSASRLAVRMDGTSQVSAMDSRGWTAVRERDFASPHVSRLVRPASELAQSTATARISSAPLRTDAPRRGVSVVPEVQRAIRGPEDRAVPDITDVVARRSDLSADRAAQLARPVAVDDVANAHRATTAPQARAASAPASRDAAIGRTLGWDSSANAFERDRSAMTNRYRSRYGPAPTEPFGGTGRRTPTLGGGSTGTTATRPSTTGVREGIRRPPTSGVATRGPSVSSRPPTSSSSGSTSRSGIAPRVPVTRSSGVTGRTTSPQRPVIVPRSPTTRTPSTSTPSRSGLVPRSSYIPRASSGSAMAPSGSSGPRVSAPSRSSGSRSTPRMSSGSRSSGSSSRGTVSRSSGSRSSSSRSTSTPSRSSSGGSAKRR